MFGVFVQQLIQYGPCVGAVFDKEVLLFLSHLVGTFAAGTNWRIECNVAEKIEWISIGLVRS